MDFDTALARLRKNEGGWVDNPADPGGETYKGIARRFWPTWAGWTVVDGAKAQPGFPASLGADTGLQQAVRDFYRVNFWGPAGCDAVPDGIKFDLFDTAVNSSVTTAVRLLQNAVGENVDGKLGPHTLMAVQSMDPERLIARFNGWRLDYLNDNPHLWAEFGRGWAQRIADNLKAA